MHARAQKLRQGCSECAYTSSSPCATSAQCGRAEMQRCGSHAHRWCCKLRVWRTPAALLRMAPQRWPALWMAWRPSHSSRPAVTTNVAESPAASSDPSTNRARSSLRDYQAPRITGSAKPVAADEPGEHLALVSTPVRGALREAAMVGEGKENLMPSPPVRSAKARTTMDPSDYKCRAHDKTCMRGHHVDAGCLRLSLLNS